LVVYLIDWLPERLLEPCFFGLSFKTKGIISTSQIGEKVNRIDAVPEAKIPAYILLRGSIKSETRAYPEQPRIKRAYTLVSASPGVVSMERPHQRKPIKTANSNTVLSNLLFICS
jgi:hypothetical protein